MNVDELIVRFGNAEPSDQKARNYINLTNGLEFVLDNEDFVKRSDIRLVRMQSTHLEQSRWEDFILSISDEFLFDLARGSQVNLFDCGSRLGAVSRVVWQGMPMLRTLCMKSWYGIHYPCYWKDMNATGQVLYFYNNSPKVRRRLHYFKNFVANTVIDRRSCNTYVSDIADNCLRILAINKRAEHDNDRDYFGTKVKQCTIFNP